MTTLPQHLARPLPADDAHVYGTLHYEESVKGRFWIIEGEPEVCIKAKRLFPGSSGRGRGVAKFPAHRRTFEDLVWLQQRYPLKVMNVPKWEQSYSETTAHNISLQEQLKNPTLVLPPAVFTGQLRPFQQESLSWMQSSGRTIVADEMGLGKTVTALAYIAASNNYPFIVVPPPHLVTHWETMIPAFLDAQRSVPLLHDVQAETISFHTITGQKPYLLPDAHVYIIHYLLLSHWWSILKKIKPHGVIFDEIQELRHAGTQKYSAAHDVACHAHAVFGLSGTPIYNYGEEIWNVTNIIDMHCLGDRDSFTKEWCIGYGSKEVEDPERLGQHLRREGLMIRHRKDDVLDDLPEKNSMVQIVDGDDALFSNLVRTAVKLAKDAAKVKDPLRKGRMEREAQERARRATGEAKAPAVAAFVRGLMETEEPTLVFAHHHTVVDHLLDSLAEFNPVCITGRQTKQQKAESVKAFKSGETNLCIISLRAAAGIDGLQERTTTVVFAELDWSPAVHSQAEDRGHRMGLRNVLNCFYLVVNFGTDPNMMEALGLKVAQSIGIMGDKPISAEAKALQESNAKTHMRKVVDNLRELAA